MFSISEQLLTGLLEFREARDWGQFHTPRNLAASLVIEASELLECFQWAHDDDLERIVTEDREPIEDELADVAILLSYLCVDLNVDLETAVRRKMAKNELKYPVDQARGTSKKYDKL